MRKGGMLLFHVKDPGPDVCVVGEGRRAWSIQDRHLPRQWLQNREEQP